MANVILTSTGVVAGPPLAPEPPEERGMADAPMEYPHWYYSSQVPAGRVFESKEEMDAASAEGPWYPTPTEAADAAAKDATPPPDEGESHAPRSRR